MLGRIDLVAHGDTGCYTMLMFAPTEQLMHNYSGMGLGGGTGSGIDLVHHQQADRLHGRRHPSSTPGRWPSPTAIKNGQDITYILLLNGTTAMTGHQEHAGTELGRATGNRNLGAGHSRTIIRSMAGTSPLTRPPNSRRRIPQANIARFWRETILQDGVKVIIADKECGITHHRDVLREAERKDDQGKYGLPPEERRT